MTNSKPYTPPRPCGAGQNNTHPSPNHRAASSHTTLPNTIPMPCDAMTPPRGNLFERGIRREVIDTRLRAERVYAFLKTLINEYCVSSYNFTRKL
jgi:hypothetical protein